MNGNHLKKVQPGQPLKFPAEAYNAFIDAARDYQNRQRGLGSAPQPVVRSSGIVLVRNDSGYNVMRFGVLGISAPIIKPEDNLDGFKSRVALVGVTPITTSHAGKFVVLLEPIKSGAIGLAAAAGVCPVKIDVPDEEHEYPHADVTDANRGNLKAAKDGAATILWRAGGTGVQWAMIRFGGGGGLPPTRSRYMVLQILDDAGTVGWEYPRFH